MSKHENKSIFISHNHRDKPFVLKLAKDLESYGIKSWIDEAEMHFGDSLINKISNAIENIDCVLAVISSNSYDSSWVRQELEWAMTKEIKNQKVVIIPIVIDKVDIPFFIAHKYYADFTDKKRYFEMVKKLADSIKYHRGNISHNEKDTIVFGHSINIKYNPTLIPFFLAGSLIVLSIAAIIGTNWFLGDNQYFENAQFIKKNINTFWVLMIALMMGEIIRLLLIKYQAHIDPDFAFDNQLVRTTSIFFKNYRKVIKKYRKKLLVKVIVLFEIVILVGIFFALSYAYEIVKIAIK